MLRFNLNDLRPLVEHTKSCTEHFPTYGQQQEGEVIPAGLWLVHDEGVYLMSNGKPSLPRGDNNNSSKVVYAEYCHPQEDEDYYDNAREEVGGDDFAEYLPLDVIETGLQNNGRFLDIQLEEGSMLVQVIP